MKTTDLARGACFKFAWIAALCVAGAAHAATLIPVLPPPDAAPHSTAVFGINDNNVIAGAYGTSDGVEHGFFGPLNGEYSIFTLGSEGTQPRGINDAGIIMGISDEQTGNALPFERFADGSISYVRKGGVPLGYGITGGINSQGIFVASGYDESFTEYLSFYGKKAKYWKPIEPPGFASPHPRGIDDAKLWLVDRRFEPPFSSIVERPKTSGRSPAPC